MRQVGKLLAAGKLLKALRFVATDKLPLNPDHVLNFNEARTHRTRKNLASPSTNPVLNGEPFMPGCHTTSPKAEVRVKL